MVWSDSQIQLRLQELYGPGRSIQSIERLTAGLESEIFGFSLDGLPLVLRLYQGAADGPKAEREWAILRALHGGLVRVPRPGRYSPGLELFGRPYVIAERVAGVTLRAALANAAAPPAGGLPTPVPSQAENLTDRQDLLLDQMAAVHALTPADLPNFQHDSPLSLRALQAKLPPELARLADWLAIHLPTDGEQRLTHGDLNDGNILVGPQGAPVLIDWSFAGWGDPRMDVANTLWVLKLIGAPDLADRLRSRYTQRTGITLHDLDAFTALFIGHRLLAVLLALKEAPIAAPFLLPLRQSMLVDLRHLTDLALTGLDR